MGPKRLRNRPRIPLRAVRSRSEGVRGDPWAPAELADEIAEAEQLNDRGRLERASDEREALLAELGSAARGKRASSDAERARLTVTKGIKTALDRITASHPELGAHLQATVRRGYFCSYQPDPRHPIEWET